MAFGRTKEESKERLELFLRRLRWMFSKSGIIPLAFEHFLAMIPATILVPVLVNNALGTMIVDMSLVLFTSGVGTIAFIVLSKGKIPAYLGSSFAYIGLTIYLLQAQINGGTSSAMAFSYVGWAYLFSGLLLVLLSFLYRIKGIERTLSFLLPATVVGPAISLIGLELADTAVVDSGFDIEEGLVDGNAALVAIITLAIIILFSLLRHKVLKNMAIIIGMVVGCIIYYSICGFPIESFANTKFFSLPNFSFPFLLFPPNMLGLFVSVIPATFIVFTENIGRITVISRMTTLDESDTVIDKANEKTHMIHAEVIDDETGNNELFTKQSVKKMRSSIFSHGVATFLAGMLGSVPNTLYAENIAVMSIHKAEVKREDPDAFIKKMVAPFSVVPYLVAASIAILFSFFGFLQTFLLEIPKPVIGGMELFLFGIISAPGIQLLVEQRVNYKKVSNQIITAAVLISGISGLSVDIGIMELKGMSLGFCVGILLNLLVQFIKWIGNISDTVTFDEIVADSLSAFSATTRFRVLNYKKDGEQGEEKQRNFCIEGLLYSLRGKDCRVLLSNGEWVSDDTLRDEIDHTSVLSLGVQEQEYIRFRKTANGIFVDVRADYIPHDTKTAFLNDYDAIDEEQQWLHINATENIPMRRVKFLIKLLDRQFT